MLVSVLLSLVLGIATIFLHYETLRLLWMGAPALLRRLGPRGLILTTVVSMFVAHAVEIVAYAAAFWALEGRWGLGRLGTEPLTFDTALFLSAESYATLGLGPVEEYAPLRWIAGTEALTGLLLITWSASFTYLIMRRAWRVEREEADQAPTPSS